MTYFITTLTLRRISLLIAALMLAIAIPGLFALRSAQAAVNTIIVNANSDSNTCSAGTITLRCAIATANANTSSPTMIAFNFSGMITVGSVLTINNTAQPITIDGSGQNIDVDGGGSTQIFNIASGTTAAVNVLTISNGNSRGSTGGAGGNGGDSNGGGVYNAGTLTISNSTLSGNSATGGSGGTGVTIVYGGNGNGGGVYNSGTLTISSSILSGNSAIGGNGTSGVGGGGVGGMGKGGGVYNSGTLTISSSILSGNSAIGGNGSAGIVQSGNGGGVYNTSALTISNSTLAGNSAIGAGDFGIGPGGVGNGGGVYDHGTGALTISSSTLSTNSATGGTDFFGSNGSGGGVYDDSAGALTISNSTLSNNLATGGAGFTFQGGNGWGGGVYDNGAGALAISNSTLSGNSATGGSASNNGSGDGGGGFGLGTTTMNLLSTIVAKNSASTSAPDIRNAVTSLGHNLIGDGTASSGLINGTNNDQVGTQAAPIDPKLGALANNGGPTQTLVLQSGSPAISKGNCTAKPTYSIPAVTVDQRGFGRKSPCDVGAYESSPSIVTNTPSPTNTATSTNTPTNTSTNTATATPTSTATGTRVPSAIDSIGVYANGLFYLSLHNATGMADLTTAFNPAGKNIPIVGDWTGAGYDSIGVYDQNAGNFTLCTSNVTATCALPADQIAFTFGNPNDTPLAGRWTSSALHTGAGVYRPSNGILYIKSTLTTGFADHAMVLGNPGDQGLAGDWTGKGYDSTGVYRPTNSLFYLSNQIGDGIIFSDQTLQFGTGGVAIVGDWIGQGHDGVGLYNTSANAVFLKNTLVFGLADNSFTYGSAGAQPIAGHWQVIYPPRAPISPAPVLLPKTAIPLPGSISAPGGNQIGG